MSAGGRTSRRRVKRVIRQSDDSFYDVDEDKRITREDLRDHLAGGGLFEVRRQSTGADCTYEVVQEIVAAAQPDAVTDLLPGVLPAGGLGNATSPLSALGSMVSLLSGSGSAPATDDRSSSRRGLRPGWGEWGQGGKPRRSKMRGSANWSGLDAGETNGEGE